MGDDEDAARTLKGLFDLVGLDDRDFAYFVNWGLMTLQATHWDPDIDHPGLAQYCAAITSDVPWYASTRTVAPDVETIVKAGGYAEELDFILPR